MVNPPDDPARAVGQGNDSALWVPSKSPRTSSGTALAERPATPTDVATPATPAAPTEAPVARPPASTPVPVHPGAPTEVEQRFPVAADLAGRRVEIDQTALARTIDRSVGLVRDQQERPGGYWVAELEANAVLNSEWIFTLHYLGLLERNAERAERLAQHLLSTQREDGSWALHWVGDGDLDATIEAYAALKLVGYEQDHPALAKARAFIHERGGLIEARMVTRIYLALIGEFPWQGTPGMPAQVIFLPHWMKMNIYDMSYWARTCTVPLLILCTLQNTRPVPAGRGCGELFLHAPRSDELSFESPDGFFSWSNFFVQTDKIIKIARRAPIKITEGPALRACERWIREHQDEPGDWGGILPAITHCLMALSSLGHDETDDAVRRGLEALYRHEIDATRDDGVRQTHIQPCVSPVWDTVWCMMALQEADVSRDDAQLDEATTWMYEQQITRPGDWAVKNPEVPAGGWAFQFANDFYPDIDDTSVVLMSLLRSGIASESELAQFDLGMRWMLGLQNSDGGFGAFEKDNCDETWNKIIFNDANNMLDPSTVDVSGRVIEFLGRLGRSAEDPSVKPIVDYVLSEQESDGKWWGRWGTNYVYGTWSVLAGLHTVGLPPSHPAVARGAAWLESYQNADGGFGESCDSYEPGREAEKCASTPSQTAWALLGLLAAGRGKGDSAVRAAQWLIDRQKDDGDWDELEFTGNGFPGVFYLRYHMYRLYFPLLALARWRKAIA